MCHESGPSALNRRDFLRITAAGSALLWAPERLEALASGMAGDLTPLQTALAAAAVPGTPDSVGTTLYTGAPGIVLFLSELVHATHDQQALEDAMAGADHLMGVVREADTNDPGLYTGLAGIAYTLERVHQVSGEARFLDGATWCIDEIIASAQTDRGGIGWSYTDMDNASSDIVSGAAGIGLTLLWANRALDHPRALEMANAAGVRLATLGEETDGGLMWRLNPAFTRNYPNFSHGTAGVAYFLARLWEETIDATFLSAAKQGATYLEAAGRCNAEGCAVFHHEPGGEDLFYLSWCHGPAGTARLFHQLSAATGEPQWSEWVHRGARAIQAYGVPEQRSPGYWNNISQCCGDAGVGEFFLALQGITGSAEHGAYAHRIGDYILNHSSEEHEGRRWVQAEHRTAPEGVVAQTGWMQGASGVAAFFLHLDGQEKGRPALVSLPDSPW